jgi:hypothetical protein
MRWGEREEKLGCSHLCEGESVRVLFGRIERGPNFLSQRETKTRKLGGCCSGTTNGDTLGED